MVPWSGPRTKVQIRLSIQRLRTLQDKKLALAKAARRDIADLLPKGRVETARLRVEGLIQDDIYVELLEVMELYAETLQARFNLLDASVGDTPDASIADAVCAVVYAATRTEIKELHVLREMLMHKYGREFSLALQPSTPPPASVPPRVLAKLALFTPGKELVDAYLGEIARGYGVPWAPEPDSTAGVSEAGAEGDGLGAPPGGVELERGGSGEVGKGGAAGEGKGGKADGDGDGDDFAGGDAAEEQDKPRAAAATAPPPPPAGPEKDAWASGAPVGGGGLGGGVGGAKGKGDEDEELAKRFERLKNLR